MGGRNLETANGALKLEDKRISIHTDPGAILENQARRVRQGALLRPLGFLVFALVGGIAIAIEMARLFTALGEGESAVLASASVGLILLFVGYATYFTPQQIPLNRINKIQVDPGNGTLAVDYEPPRSVTSWLSSTAHRPTVSLLQEEDLQQFTDWIQVRGVEYEEVEEGIDRFATDAEYSFLRGGGGYFCPECDERVGPRDKLCEDCGYQLLPSLNR